MKTFDEILSEITAKLTGEQIQLLKDTINYGCWGDCDMEFLEEDGKPITDYAMGYITNEAKQAGHFCGRKASAMFRSMYKRLGMAQYSGEGRNSYFCHISDWWGDGTGDMLFIRSNRGERGTAIYEQFEEWAKEKSN